MGESIIIADKFLERRMQQAKTHSIFIEATEATKSLDAVPPIIEEMRKSGANRQTDLAAVGGGVIQDVSAFIASVYMRGIAWSYIPTTVLAMVDSCIGGKSSINVGPYKNLVGTFHPPQQILIDPALVQTLPDEQKVSGLIEAAKICFCRGPESFACHLSYQPSVSMTTEALETLITNSLLSKKWFIEIDEFDKKERLILNFGHTFGHAIEGASRFTISHGVGVGLGMLCALEFERQIGASYLDNLRVKTLESHLDEMLRSIESLSSSLRDLSVDEVFERFCSDKKHGPKYFSLILVEMNGAVVLRKLDKSQEVIDRIKRSIFSVIERYA